jgi:hypothetical protein
MRSVPATPIGVIGSPKNTEPMIQAKMTCSNAGQGRRV